MATKKEGVKAKTGLDLQRQRDAKFATLSSDVEVARRRAGKIRDGLRSWTATRDAIIEAFQKQDWFTLGYTSWDDYCDVEFSGSKLNLSEDDRREAILAFASVGMTLREIGSAAGTSKDTASRVLKASRVSDETKSPLVDALRGEIEAAAERTETSGAVPPADTDSASPVVGEPDDSEEASESSGTQDSPAADPLSDSSSHAGVPAVGDQIEERIEEEAAEASADLPAAAMTSLPDGDGDPTPEPEQQPGHNSPTGQEAVQPHEGRSETDHQQDAGVSSPAGEAPEAHLRAAAVEPVELEGGGTAQDPPSSSDPEVDAGEQLLLAFAELVNYLDGVDFEAVGPTLPGADLEALHSHVEAISAYVGRLGRARFEAMRTP